MFSRPEFSVLFVCTANICRSPMAHGLLKHHCDHLGLGSKIRVDSAGTRVSVRGQRPDVRAQAVLAKQGIDISRLKSRPVVNGDFDKFDCILGMEQEHLDGLGKLSGSEHRARVGLIMEFARRHTESKVPDPYFGNEAGFERVLTLLEDAVQGLADNLLNRELAGRGGIRQ